MGSAVDSAHPPDTLQESEVVSKRPDTGCLNSPQAGLKAAIRQPPESRLIDTVAALTRARLARRAASEEFCLRLPRHPPDGHLAGSERLCLRVPEVPSNEPVAGEREFRPRVQEVPPEESILEKREFRPQIPKDLPNESVAGEGVFRPRVAKYLPDGFLGTDKQCSRNIVNKTTGTSTSYSPLAKAALSLPETPPAFLSQVLVPHPEFNGHKPILLIEGERWLKTSVVNKINRKSIVEHLLIVPETVAGQSQAVKL
jgi:hypothetical protein